MTPLHPHWQTTDEDEQPVRITTVDASEEPLIETKVPRAKRTPAAFIGVVLFIALGFIFFKGNPEYTGQITEADIEVIISQTGVEPESVSVMPGETIKWINRSGIPQILESSSIFMDDGEPFKTTAIFPDAYFMFTVPFGAPAGTYEYESSTSGLIAGEIVVEESIETTVPAEIEPMPVSAASSSSSSSIAPLAVSSSSVPAAVVTPVSQSSASSIASVMPQTASVGGIPVNPHTIGTTNTPTPQQLHSGAPLSQTVTKHKPLAQPVTGMGAWTVAIMGTLALMGVLIRARKIA